MKLAIFGFGNFAKELLKSHDVQLGVIFDISQRKVGKTFNDIEIKPGILLDSLPGTWKEKIVSSDLKEIKEIIENSGVEVGIICINSFAKKSAEAYAELLINSGVHVVNVTPIPLSNDEKLQRLADRKNVYLLGDFIKPVKDPLNQILAMKEIYGGETFIIHRISFDLASMIMPNIKREVEERFSDAYGITYTIDPRKELRGYAELDVAIFSDIEASIHFRYPLREMSVSAILEVIKSIKRGLSVEEIKREYFYF